jgi:hypothetical protein
MKKDYVITNEETTEKGLDLNEYALDGTLIPAIINRALDICVTRICYLNDDFTGKGELAIEEELEKDAHKTPIFKKLQYQVLYNLIFTSEDSPTDLYVDSIISHELGWAKINGFQKGIYHKQ